MKLNSVSLMCLLLLLFHTNFSLARRSSGSKKSSTPSRGSTHTSSNKGHKTNQDSSSQDSYSKQPGQTNQGGYAPQPGKPGYPGSYPQQPVGGGYHYQYPARGSPYGGGYGTYGVHGGYGSHGGQGGYGGYPGGFLNYNPKNRILSPRFGGSYGYGGYGNRGGSQFSNSVQAMGIQPDYTSKEYGRSGQMAAAKGAMVGMAVGYGLGRVPRPHFQVHNRQEERYYNHYMYRKYGSQSTDTNDYSRDYAYSQPPQSYENYMDSCMKRKDLLIAENPKPNNKPAATTATAVTTATTMSVTTTNTSVTTKNAVAADTVNGTNTMVANSTAADNSSTSVPSTPRPLNQPKANPVPSTTEAHRRMATGATGATGATDDDDDDTVSIVEIGYPALIEQQKVKRCVEKYMVYSENYLKKLPGGGPGLRVGSQWFLAVVTSTILMLLNSNMLVLLH